MLRGWLGCGPGEICRPTRRGKAGHPAIALLCAGLGASISFIPRASFGQLGIEVTGSQTFRTALPGEPDVQCFTLRLASNTLFPATLQRVEFSNRSAGPGSQAQLDAELGQPRLYRDDGDGVLEPGGADGQPLAQASAAGGVLVFASLSVTVPAFGSVTLLVGTDIPLNARDGDNLDLAIEGPSSLTFDSQVGLRNSWPVDPPGAIAPDGISAAQIVVTPIGPATILAGTRHNLALSVVLPPNGYQPDRLETLALVNDGTASAGSDLEAMDAWADNGDGILEPTADRRIGALSFTGDRWQLTGLTETVPSNGLRILLSVDLGELATEGGTIRLGFPTLPNVGIGMISANDGPLDRSVGNPHFLTVSTADRIMLAADSLPAQVVAPGQQIVLLTDLSFRNSYQTSRTLSDISFTNVSSGAGPGEALDSEFERLTLRFDGNGDELLGDETDDPVLGTAFFHDGEAAFGPLAWVLDPGGSHHLFLTGDVAIGNAADGDILGVSLLAASDLRFDDSTRVVASWPLDSGARASVDGMVSGQITNFGAPALSLGPGDGPVLGLDVIVPRNGYVDDVLNEIRVVNLGTARDTDLAEVRFWRDGGDGGFTPGSGDDQDLGPATWEGDHWRSPALAEAVSGAGARLFVSLVVSTSPADSATVRLAIPVGGVACGSGNDGPLDRSIENPNTTLLSAGPLLASIEIIPGASTIGQTVAASMVVRNIGSEAIHGITPSSLISSGDGSFTPISGPEPPSFDLAPAAVDTFEWRFTASTSGEVRFSGNAEGTGSPSGLLYSSSPVFSNTHRVFEQTQSVDLTATSSMPASVNRGQEAVVPLSLEFANAGAEASTVRLRELRLEVQDEAGAGIIPSSVINQVAASVGAQIHLLKTDIETGGSEITLTLASPVSIEAGETVALTIAIDISASTTVPIFRLAIRDGASFVAEDANSGAPVSIILQSGSYPVLTGLARVFAPATELDVAALATAPERAGRGEAGVPLVSLRIESPGLAGITSDVRVFGFSVVLEDTNGATVGRPRDFLDRIQVEATARILTDRPIGPSEGPALVLALNPPLIVPASTPLDMLIRGDISDTAPLGTVRLRLLDPSLFEAEDANTGDPVPAVYDASPLAGGIVTIEAEADTLFARGIPRFPPRASVGTTGVRALTMILRHPGSAGTARIAVDAITVHCRDELRRPLIPSAYIDQLEIEWNGTTLATLTDPPSTGSSMTLPLPAPLIEPADSALVDVFVDFSAAAPVGSLELMVFADGVGGSDANLATPVTVTAEGGDLFPLVSGLCRLDLPPRELLVGLTSRMPAALAADGRPVPACELTLTNTASPGSDSILVDHLVLRAADREFRPVPVGMAAGRVEAYWQGALWGASGPLTPDSVLAVVAGGPVLRVPPGEPMEIEIVWTVVGTGPASGFRLGVDAEGVGVVQPSSALLQVRVEAADGSAFPLWSEPGSFSPTTLRESYANYPNPFAAGRETTHFAYFLPAPGSVTLRIFTPAGESVATLVSKETRAAGMNQSDLWDGRNGRGNVVRNGAYVAELVVDYASGPDDRVLRKVAVVR